MSLNVTAALYGTILKEVDGGFEERVNDAKKFMDWLFFKTGVQRNVKDTKVFVAGGTGRYAIAAAELGVQDISHMDLSEENVKRIQGISDQNSFGIRSIQGNLMDLDLENESVVSGQKSNKFSWLAKSVCSEACLVPAKACDSWIFSKTDTDKICSKV